ncbi:MAG: hypothetical protein NTY95_14425 [Bacteroidia bacterium]|nr:hypothetical protein [Bacteroidia bacterium]
MSTLIIPVSGTNISPFSASNTYNVLNGGYLIDPMAYPLSFYYALTANGGSISTTYLESLSGGIFELAYDDLRYNPVTLDGHFIFCESEVIFDFSNFDQTESKIIKIIFNPGNSKNIETYNSYVSNNQITYPVINSIKASYYPSEEFYTFYNPSFKIYYSDGNIVNITIPLTSVQCGIFESYKDKTIVETIPLYKNTDNVITFINDRIDNNIIIANVSTTAKFELEATDKVLPFSTIAPFALPFGSTSLEEIIVKTIEVPKPPVVGNPLLPPNPTPTPTPSPTPSATPLPNLGIISFTNEQMDSFNNEDMYPFDGGVFNGIIMFDTDSITEFNGDLLYPFT